MQVNNAKQWPLLYSCKFLTSGLVSYEDSGAGIALLKKETIDDMLSSFIGRPVLIDHHDVNPDNYKQFRVGNVVKCWFNPADGWFYADFLVEEDEAVRCIEEDGYSVSCAYNVLDAKEGGMYQDIKFDGEITKGSFTHLALVKEPRYEESKIMKESPMMLVNSKQAHYVSTITEEKDMFKIFKKNAKEEKELYTGMVVNIDGAEMPVDHLIKNYQDVTAKEAEELKKKEEEKKNAKTLMNSTDIIDLNGNKVTIGEMIEKIKGSMVNDKAEEKKEDKENEKEDKQEKDTKKEEEDGKAQKDVAEEKKNESDKKEEEKVEKKDNEKEEDKKEEKVEEKEKSKENSKRGEEYFVELQNASKGLAQDEGSLIRPLSRSERAKEWASRNSKKQ